MSYALACTTHRKPHYNITHHTFYAHTRTHTLSHTDGSAYHGMLEKAVCQGKGLYTAMNGNKILGEFDAGASNGTGCVP